MPTESTDLRNQRDKYNYSDYAGAGNSLFARATSPICEGFVIIHNFEFGRFALASTIDYAAGISSVLLLTPTWVCFLPG